ncbi:TPA: hypothetical protein RSV51_002130, partial [Mannheimia haemolytica]|nr:hypothetical protein [Mannheimia haemolytica]
MTTVVLDTVKVVANPPVIKPIFPPEFSEMEKLKRENYYFGRRIAYAPNKVQSYVSLANSSVELSKKINELEKKIISAKSIGEIFKIISGLLMLYAKILNKVEQEKLKKLYSLLVSQYDEVNKIKKAYLSKKEIAEKAEKSNLKKFALTKVNPRDYDLILSVSGGSRLWWLHVGKHKADEVNEAQKLIDALIILNETLTEFSNESHRLVTTLSRHIVTNIKQTPKLPITSRNRNTPVTSFDMLYYYRAKTGKSVTLKQLGLFNTVRELVKKPNALGKKDNRSVHGDFIQQIITKNARSFKNTYSFKEGIWNINNALWAIGSAIVEGNFTGSAVQKGDRFYLEGSIDYSFYDKFTDPYDIFNIIPGEWNPDGTSYDIKDNW